MARWKFLAGFGRYLSEQGYKDNSIKTYDHNAELFLRWLPVRLREQPILVDALVLDQYVSDLHDMGFKQTTINTRVNAVSHYFEWLADRGLVNASPVLKRHHTAVYLDPPASFSDDEIKDALREIGRFQNNIEAAFLTMFATGIRVSECASLRLKDFHQRDGILWAYIHNSKYNSDRTIPFLQEEYSHIVKKYLDGLVLPDEKAFRLTARTIQKYAQIISEEVAFHFYCHRIRHTVAETMHKRGYSLEQIQGQLGHINIRVTSYYAKAGREVSYEGDIYK